MFLHRRLAAFLAVAAIGFTACSGAATPAPTTVPATPVPATVAPVVTPVPVAAVPATPVPATPVPATPVPATVAPTDTPVAAAPVTIEWWHITTGDPGKTVFQGIADAYTAAHPNVKINITILENEAFKTKLATSLQSGEVPDLFQSWGGGIMAAQADAGVLKDITADIAPIKDTINAGALGIYAYKGVQYGVPWDMGMIGVWYNKALFTKAGISAPPATWDDFLADVGKLKAAGIVPARHRGQGHVAVHAPLDVPRPAHRRRRQPDPDGPERQLEHGRLHPGRKAGPGAQRAQSVPARLQGRRLQRRGRGGRQRQGRHGSHGPVGSRRSRRTRAPARRASAPTSAGSRSRRSTGGAGAPTDGVGGGNGIAVGKNASPEALDFLKFFNSVENATKINTSNIGLSPVVGTESAITDPNLQAVLAGRGKATFMQLYLDQATSRPWARRSTKRPSVSSTARRPRRRSARRSRTPRPPSSGASRAPWALGLILKSGPAPNRPA